jgi:hypothetical protein
MEQIRRAEDERADAVRQLWEVHAEILKKRGYDLDHLLKDWTQKQISKLISPGARVDFDELSASGCIPQVLAALLALLKWSPTMENFWAQLYGNPEKRKAVVKSLEGTASAVERFFTFIITYEDEEVAAKLEELGRITPKRLVTELRFYAQTLDFLNRIPRETKTRSLGEFARFALTDYVKTATGSFRDRNVSGLLGEVVGPPDYNEVAQRMWRHRNFVRMKNYYSLLSELLLDIGQVLASQIVTPS